MKKEKIKVLILIKVLNIGGAERLLVDSIPYLDQVQFDYHFAYLLSSHNFLVEQFETNGFPVHCLGMRSNYHLPLMLQALQKLQRKHNFDLIHADLPLAGILARIVGRWHKTPVIYTEHGPLERSHPLTSRINRLTYGWNTQVLAVSQQVFDSITRFNLTKKTKVTTLLNGVPVEQIRAEAGQLADLRQELNIPEEHLVVGTVAVFRHQKLLGDWLEVAQKIAEQWNNVTFLLVGYGPEDMLLRTRVNTLGLINRVRMPGFRSDGRRLMGVMDIYLMSSAFEGLPIALLEAMTLAKPVVTTEVGGIPEAVQHGKEGFLAPVGAIDKLANYTIQLLNDSTLRLEMGQRGAKKVDAEFQLKNRTRSIESIYLEMLHN